MKISDILSRDCVLAPVSVSSKRELLEMLAIKAAKVIGVDEHVVADSVIERENLGSTGYGNGAAFPHARIDGLERVFAVFAKLQEPVDFDAADHKPVDLVFLLISPENSGADHLTALAAVSRVLKDDAMRKKLRAAETAGKIYEILTE